ncbi:hypothetical protein [Thalassotalea sp. PP2-459]|uniref:hypothetical protein n=1 Tax=Thalassotalea sp. PP2-459 TaxID=1742724 RepID=UPI000945DFC9|nr:hypothetical protein [Thalassotalea sp. PP2-459]OKY25322.1 hypothetical protein BI291_03020 [Thalassotalea sp. PP2-459]
MDVLADLLPPSYLVKSETTAKDRQPEQHEPQQEQSSEENNETAEQTQKKKKAPKKAYFVERRSGEDRRLHQKNRGRWLDSRLNKDRRKENIKTEIKLSI